MSMKGFVKNIGREGGTLTMLIFYAFSTSSTILSKVNANDEPN